MEPFVVVVSVAIALAAVGSHLVVHLLGIRTGGVDTSYLHVKAVSRWRLPRDLR